MSKKNPSAWNFASNYESVKRVGQIVNMIVEKWGYGKWLDISDKNEPHEANLLSLDITKARNFLDWYPKWDVRGCINKSVL